MKDMNIVEILLVEDNPNDAELTMRALKKNKLANNVMIARDGTEALDFLFCRGKFGDRDITSTPKVVLLDLKLPKINGLEVLKIIKEDSRTSSVPVVVVTSSAEEPDIQEAYLLGANSFIVKPVDFEQFINTMSSLGLYWLVINKPLK
jgi:two-component system response regulator